MRWCWIWTIGANYNSKVVFKREKARGYLHWLGALDFLAKPYPKRNLGEKRFTMGYGAIYNFSVQVFAFEIELCGSVFLCISFIVIRTLFLSWLAFNKVLYSGKK